MSFEFASQSRLNLMFGILRQFKWRVVLAFFTMVLTATLFGTGLGLLLPALHLLLGQKQTLRSILEGLQDRPEIPSVVQEWCLELSNTIPEDSFLSFFLVMAVICVIGIGSSLFRYFHLVLVADIVIRSAGIWRSRLFEHIIRLPMIRFLKTNSSDFISRVISDTRMLSEGYQVFLGTAPVNLARGMAALCVAILMDWRLTLLALAGAIPLGFLMHFLNRRTKMLSKSVLQQDAHLLSAVQSPLLRISTLKQLQAESYEEGTFQQANRAFIDGSLALRRAKAFGPALVEAITLLGLVLLACLAGWFILKNGIEPAKFLTVLIGLAGASQGLKTITKLQQKWSQTTAVLERQVEALTYPIEGENERKQTLPEFQGEITFRNLEFTYPGRVQKALSNVNFTIKHRQLIALVGPNGAGKSTLINLLSRLLEPDSGVITIDGLDIRMVSLQSLRRQIAVVPQEPILFEDSIYHNIIYGNPNISRERVVESAKESLIHDFIESLPEGYNTLLREYGSSLSVGQKQRIALTRALVRKPSILVLDEPTNHLDSESEEKIRLVLPRLANQSTLIVIAHRLNTIAEADKIIVVNEGQVIGSGNHRELLRKCSLYQELWRFDQIQSNKQEQYLES